MSRSVGLTVSLALGLPNPTKKFSRTEGQKPLYVRALIITSTVQAAEHQLQTVNLNFNFNALWKKKINFRTNDVSISTDIKNNEVLHLSQFQIIFCKEHIRFERVEPPLLKGLPSLSPERHLNRREKTVERFF